MKNFLKLITIPLVLLSLHVNAQKSTLEGIVLTKTDQAPLPGATVIIKGTTQGTQTDVNGKFSIAASTGDIIQVSFIGFKAQQIQVTVTDNSPLQIVLEEDDNRLQEVVITALGISKEKKSLGYAVQELKSKDITESRTPNLVNALTGKIAGVNITNSQGGMGSSRIVIRGETSIAGNNQPLFVVDGVPVDNSQLGASGASRDFANAISDINSEDIESISVLKGPNAAALYGSRAANGVILIKTKSGKGKKGIGISITSNTTFENLLVLPEYQNVYGQGSGGEFEYVDGKGGGINDGVDESWGPKMDGRLIKQFYSSGEAVPFEAHPNNVRDFFVTGYTLNNGVALAGSKEDFDYRFSYNNSYQKGVVPNTDLTKNSFAINSSYKLLPNLTISTSANFIRNSSDNLPGTFGKRSTSTMLQYTWFGRQVDINRLKNYRDENGNTFNWNNSYYSNPYFIAYENTVSQRRDRIFGNVNLTYNITPDLTANLRTGNDYYNDRRKIKVAYGTNGTPFGSYQEIGYTVNENNTQFTLNYKKDLSDNFSLDILGGGNLQSRFFEENNQRAPRLAVKDVYTLNNSRDPLESTNFFSKQKIYSVFSSAQLGFRNYAFLNLTARNDWSSTLPIQHNSYFYPSVNASIVLSEALAISSDALTFLKIRGGWSKVGKDSDPYQLINTYPFNTPFGSAPLITVSDKSLNPNLKPETTTSTEIGAEAGFLDDRIKLDVSYYNTNSFDQILNVDVSASTGYTSQLINAGRINNKGLEVQLNLTPIRIKSGFSWEIGANFAANRSEVVELDKEGFLTSYRIGTDGVEVQAAIDQRYGTLFGTAFQRNENGQIVVNANGTPVVNPAKQVLGAYQPKWWGSISNAFSYKGLSLSFLIDTKVGGSIYSGTYSTGVYTGVLIETLQGRDEEHGGLPYYYVGNNNKTTPIPLEAHEAATPAGETVYHDGMIFDGVNADGSQNTRIVSAQQYHKSFRNINEASVFDASFVKLRELRLGYTLPSTWTNKVGISNASVALVGRNLWIIHKNVPHIDPETAFTTGNAQGTESLQLPTTRSLGFNVSLNF